jgi:ribose/xylose/arabinose/galactoside ABC-type transport system permease subunit
MTNPSATAASPMARPLPFLAGFRARDVLPYVILIGLVIYFSLASPIFFSAVNGWNIVRHGSILLIVSLGATFVILQGGIDLSVGSTATLAGICAAFLVQDYGFGLWGFVAGLIVGSMIGAIVGVLVAYVRVPSFLVTLGMLSVVAGIGNYMTFGTNKRIIDPGFSNLVRGVDILGIPNLFWWALALLAITWVLERFTKFGRYSFAIGGSELVSSMAGVPVLRYKLYAFVACGALAGLAGTMLAARLGAAGPGLGESLMLQSITAVAIGGTALTGGVGGIKRTLLGVLVITLLSNGLILTQVSAFAQQIITGLVLILAVTLSLDRRRIAIFK